MPTYGDSGVIVDFDLTDGGFGFAPGDIIGQGQFVVDTVSTSTAIEAFDNATSSIVVSGDVTAAYPPDSHVRVYGSTSNDHQYYVSNSVFETGSTTLTVSGKTVNNEAPAGFITVGVVLTLHLGWAVGGRSLGLDGAGYSSPSDVAFRITGVAGKTLTLEKIGDSRALFESFPTVYLQTFDQVPPTGFYTIDSTAYSDGATSITVVEDLTASLPDPAVYYSALIPVPPSIPLNEDETNPITYDVTDIAPGDGTLRLTIDYIVVDI